MKSTRSFFMMLFVALLLISFMSLPVLSGNGDEDPWGADDPDGTTGGSMDTLVVVNSLYSNVGTGNGIGTLEELVFSVSFKIVYYLFGSSIDSSSQPAVSSTQIPTDGDAAFLGSASNSNMK